MDLTNDAKKLLHLLHKEYKRKLKAGMDKTRSMKMGNSDDIQSKFFPKKTISDVNNLIYELSSAGYLTYKPYDNKAFMCTLTNNALIAVSNRPKEFLLSLADFISKIKPF